MYDEEDGKLADEVGNFSLGTSCKQQVCTMGTTFLHPAYIGVEHDEREDYRPAQRRPQTPGGR